MTAQSTGTWTDMEDDFESHMWARQEKKRLEKLLEKAASDEEIGSIQDKINKLDL